MDLVNLQGERHMEKGFMESNILLWQLWLGPVSGRRNASGSRDATGCYVEGFNFGLQTPDHSTP